MKVKRVSASFTRPSNTTQYASDDLVANSTSSGQVVPLYLRVGEGGINIVAIKLEKSGTTATSSDFDVHLFGTAPTVTNGDNAAFASTYADKIAEIDMATMVAASDRCWTSVQAGATGFETGLWHYTELGVIYALIEADGTYTPESGEVFTLTLTYGHSE